MAYADTWDSGTKKGRERTKRLLEIIPTLKWRDELGPKIKKESLFRGITFNSIKVKLHREQEQEPMSDLGKAWSKVKVRPHVSVRLFPDENRRKQFAKYANTEGVTLPQLEERFPEIKGLTARDRSEIFMHLKIRRPLSGAASIYGKKEARPPKNDQIWSLRLPDERKNELLEDWRSDPRGAGKSNSSLIEKWRSFGCTSEDALRRGVYALGETRNRLQIFAEYKNLEECENAIVARLNELVRGGILHSASDENIYTQLKEEFAARPEYSRYNLTFERFLKLLDLVIWTPGQHGTLAVLREFTSNGTPLERLLKHHPYLTLARAKAKSKEITGITNIKHPVNFTGTRAVPGVLRFLGEEGMKGGEDFELPNSSPSVLYDTGINGENWKTRYINSPLLGILHERDIDNNPFRKGLAQAQYEKFDGVFLTNVFTINTTRAAGPSRVLRALFEGLHVDEDDIGIFDPSYQEKVLRIIREHPDDEVFYETHEEMLKDLVRGLRKVLLAPGEERAVPEFSGPIWYILGKPEELIIITATYWHVHYITRIKQSDIKSELKAAESAVAMAKLEIGVDAMEVLRELRDTRKQYDESMDENMREELSRKIRTFNERLGELVSEEKLQNLEKHEQAVKDLQAEDARTRISTVATQEWKRFYQKALAGFVRLIETAIPNCNIKVIGKATTYAKIGYKRIEINIPGNERVTDRHLSAYTETYGGRVLRGEMADYVVICPQYALNMSLTGREVDSDGNRGSAIVSVAPMCVNANFLRESLKPIVQKSAHPIGRAVYNEQCQTGILDLVCTNNVIASRFNSIKSLGSYEHVKAFLKLPPAKREKNIIRGKVIRIVLATDQHWGGQAKEFIRCPESNVCLSMMDSVCHMWRKAGYGNGKKLPPCHFCLVLDDPTQAHHFDAEHQPHPHELLYPDIETLLRESLAEFRATRNLKKRTEFEDLLIKRIQYQFLIRGVYCTTNQMMLLLKQHLQPNIDMYDGILRRAVESGLVLRGISSFLDRTKVIKDTRDTGFIVMGTGNHFLKTTEGTVSEGPIYAELLKAHLLQQPYWQERADLVERYVRGPVYGKELISFGTVQAPGGYEWGLDFRNTPPGKGIDWGNPLRFCAQNDMRRANYARIFEKKVTIKAYGDKHFLSNIITSNAVYIMGPASTHTDSYGELGFPPNNTGVVFLDIPAEGPDAGPIIVRQLLFDDLKRLIEGGWRSFDWESFLPNAV